MLWVIREESLAVLVSRGPRGSQLRPGVRGAWEGPGRPGARRCAGLTPSPRGQAGGFAASL